MRLLAVFATTLTLLVAPVASAQDSAAQARSLALAERYLELSVGSGLSELMEQQFTEAFAKSEAPAEERDWMTRQMTLTMTNVLNLTLADLRDDVVGLYTDEELTALIAFYDSDMGRSIANKNMELSIAMQEAMVPHLTTAITRFGEKYCAEFGCDPEDGLMVYKPS